MNERERRLLHEVLPPDTDFEAAERLVDSGEPLAYVLGEWYFYGLTFRLNRECLIPRPDTECVVERAISLLPHDGRLLDLCTGSGCLAISVLVHRPDAVAEAVDIAPLACRMAELNATQNGVGKRLLVRCEDVLTMQPPASPRYHLIVSNPPYIRSDVIPTLEGGVRREPLIALDGGADGMRFYRRILSAYRNSLLPGGAFLFEIGYDQREQIIALAAELGYRQCTVTRDYGGCDRVALVRP